MDVVPGIDQLRPEHGPLFAVVGVFDGLHLGHAYLLEHLVRGASARAARPTVITFDHHPDEVLTGSAPPLLIDPDERLERLSAAGVAVTVVQPFDETLRRTSHDAFIEAILARTALAGVLMTPDAAFGHERRGTPETLTALGDRLGFDVVVVPSFALGGRSVRSTDIRAAIQRGDLTDAARMLGREVTLAGRLSADAGSSRRVALSWPMALPPEGRYRCRVAADEAILWIRGQQLMLEAATVPAGPVRLRLRA